MRLISWNVNGRYGPALAKQIAAVSEESPDLVALQHRLGRCPVARHPTDRLGQVVEVGHVERRRERWLGLGLLNIRVIHITRLCVSRLIDLLYRAEHSTRIRSSAFALALMRLIIQLSCACLFSSLN